MHVELLFCIGKVAAGYQFQVNHEQVIVCHEVPITPKNDHASLVVDTAVPVSTPGSSADDAIRFEIELVHLRCVEG